MKLSRKFLFVAVAVILSVSTIAMTAVYAIGGVSTCNNNLNMTATSFVIFDDVGEVNAYFVGYTGITTEAIIESKIQRRTLFWWSDVDNGETDNTWVDHFYGDVSGDVTHTLEITKKGTYRAVVTYTVKGTGGADDVIDEVIEFVYK